MIVEFLLSVLMREIFVVLVYLNLRLEICFICKTGISRDTCLRQARSLRGKKK